VKEQAMDFSSAISFSGRCDFSPDNLLFATNESSRLVVRNCESLEIVGSFGCLDLISLVRWSPDSKFIIASQYKRKLTQVFSLDDPQWSCKIDEGLGGLSYAVWAPDSRHILTVTEFQLRATIWSLLKRTIFYIKFPKFSDKGMCFSNDGSYLSVVERREYKDLIGLYSTTDWQLIKHFEVDTEDVFDIKWSPDDRYICAIDSSLNYNICIYTPDGRKIAKYKAYENMLGIKSVSWSPANNFLAVGSYDQVCRVFNNITWKALAEFEHRNDLADKHVVVYSEKEMKVTVSEKENKKNE